MISCKVDRRVRLLPCRLLPRANARERPYLI